MNAHSPRLDALARSLRVLRETVGRPSAAELALPTPCDDLDVRRLLEHVVGWQRVFAARLADDPPPFAHGSPTYVASEAVAADLRNASDALLAGLVARGGEPLAMPYRGETPVGVLVDELVAETALHTWDLGTALGRPVGFDDPVVRVAHDGLTAMPVERFAGAGFAAPTSTRAPSTEFERLLHRSGRSPVDLNHSSTSRVATSATQDLEDNT